MITLKTLPKATAQEVFNQAVTHLLTQNKKSKEGLSCMYLSESGLKCAAGCFISEDEYKKKMENQPWTFLAENGDVPREHSLLIRDLQQAHDTFEVIKWDRRLEGVAKEHKLTFTKP